MKRSRILTRLRKGLSAVGPPFGMYPLPSVVEGIALGGNDFVWVDMEHRPIDWAEVHNIGIGCRAGGIDMIVRTVNTGYTAPMKALESGASGVMIPHVRTADEARQWAQWSKYHPRGKRGFDVAGVDADFGLVSESRQKILAYMDSVNRETFCCIMVEEAELVESLDEVAAIDGVDCFCVGPMDLSLSYGVPLECDHPLVLGAIDKTSAAARKHGKFWGIPMLSAVKVKANHEKGARLFFTGIDEQDFVIEGMTRVCRELREAIGEPL